MFNISYMKIIVIVSLGQLVVADVMCTMALEVKPLEIGSLGTIPCDHVENDPEIRIVQWYKSRRIDTFVNGDPSLAQWVDGAIDSQPNYHMEYTTFSLVITNATLEDEGLYKCSVERGDLYTQSSYYTRTVMYALPQMDPEIMLDLDFNRVHCFVEHVKPLIFQVIDFDSSHGSTETHAVLNEDGTYTTSVSCTLPQDESSSQVSCSFSYLHYQRKVSLALRDITTDSLMENKATTASLMSTSVTFAGAGSRINDHNKSTITWVIVICLSTLIHFITLIILLRRKCTGKCHREVHDCKKVKESEEKMIQPAAAMVTVMVT